MTKICNKCKESKTLELFAKGKNYKDGRRNTCKRCHTDYVMEYYKNNPDKRLEKIRMNNYYRPNWSRHKISQIKYQQMFDLYGGKCHGCQIRPATSIDHDHLCCDYSWSCGKCIRGILCNQCNTALGLLAENPTILSRLAEYINKEVNIDQ